MKKIVIAMLLTLLPISIFSQSLQDGINAYNEYDYQASMDILKPLADSGGVEASYYVAVILWNGLSPFVQDRETATNYMVQSGNGNNAKAQFFLGRQNYRSENYDYSFLWYELAAHNGHSQAMAMLGSYYRNGIGCQVDLEQSLYWHDLAIENGYTNFSSNRDEVYHLIQQRQ